MIESRLACRVLLIGWDAADWKFINPLLDAGLMPNLSRLVEGGAIANLATLQPCLSPILWTSIATGKSADKHGIAGFVEPIPGGAGVRLSSSTSRTTKAIWNILSQNFQTSIVVNWFASHPAETIQGVCISNRFFEGWPRNPNDPWPIVSESVHPETLGHEYSGLRMHPAELCREHIARLIPDIGRIDLAADPRPLRLADVLAKTVSIHSVATAAMELQPWDFLAVYYDGLDAAGHHFMPFHPPKLAAVGDDDFRIYRHVMRELYLFHDEMLGRLLELAGEDTTVILISDHGFHCDHLRPAWTAELPEAQAAAWHRQYGVLAMRGPGIRRDERIYGCTLLDVAPTILNLFGLPVGSDMDGRPLLQALENPPPVIRTIKSWDQQPGPDGRRTGDLQRSVMESQAAVDQLIALGYLPAATAEARQAVAIAQAESQFNLAIVHSSHGRSRQAAEILRELCTKHPEQPRYAVALARTLANLDECSECLEILGNLECAGHRSADTDLLTAAALFNRGEIAGALERITDCERRYPPTPGLCSVIGNIHLTQRNWRAAAEAFEKSLTLDDDDPRAHNGLAQAALRLGEYERAAEHALRAVGLLFFFPQAHFHLGMALKGLGEPARAIQSLKLAVTQAPGFLEAHQELQDLNDEIAAASRGPDSH